MKRYEVTATVTAWVTAKDEDDAVATLRAGLDRLDEADMDDGTSIQWGSITAGDTDKALVRELEEGEE